MAGCRITFANLHFSTYYRNMPIKSLQSVTTIESTTCWHMHWGANHVVLAYCTCRHLWVTPLESFCVAYKEKIYVESIGLIYFYLFVSCIGFYDPWGQPCNQRIGLRRFNLHRLSFTGVLNSSSFTLPPLREGEASWME